MIIHFLVYNEVSRDGTLNRENTRLVAIRAEAIDTIESPVEANEQPDEKSVPQLHVAGRIYLLAEVWEHAVEKWGKGMG